MFFMSYCSCLGRGERHDAVSRPSLPSLPFYPSYLTHPPRPSCTVGMARGRFYVGPVGWKREGFRARRGHHTTCDPMLSPRIMLAVRCTCIGCMNKHATRTPRHNILYAHNKPTFNVPYFELFPVQASSHQETAQI